MVKNILRSKFRTDFYFFQIIDQKYGKYSSYTSLKINQKVEKLIRSNHQGKAMNFAGSNFL